LNNKKVENKKNLAVLPLFFQVQEFATDILS